MSDLRKLADNVWSFLNDTSARIGRMHAERFSQDAFVSCIEGPESPIEDLFLIAVHAQCQAEYIEVNRGPTLYQDGGPAMHDGIYAAMQARRRAAELSASPPWMTAEDWDAITEIYIAARQLSEATGIPHEVDHIVPLQGKNVSGLHVAWNLRPITAAQNRAKGRAHG